MIKVDKHPLTCACADCATMFPHDRYDAVWASPRPDGRDDLTRVVARVPIGAPNAPLAFVLWVDDDQRLVADWPGFPGSAGARVALGDPDHEGTRALTGTGDPVLSALSRAVPLRRRLAERFAARCAVEYGLAAADTADFAPCDRHGGTGIQCLTCEHLADSDAPLDAVILYSPDGDYPDILCVPCVARLAQRDLGSVRPACSRCQQASIYRHHVVSHTHYGARPTG
ncbi:MAG: hypothetical protein KC635_06460 [Myxococcales bacterium]|nr:hypothetical protein [Myxococcales bacterium]MCB9734137.1 hypothetical protein [Deltaproteobacteria bacterium]